MRRRSIKGTPRDQVERFWFFVDKDGPTVRPELGQCWTWTGAFSRGGASGTRTGSRAPELRYGAHTMNGKRTSAHRHSWELAFGTISDPRMVVRHKCDNPSCVNPSHLEVGTQRENILDMIYRGRGSFPFRGGSGQPHANAIITADTVREVRRLAAEGVRPAALAGQFSMTVRNVRAVVYRQTWKHVA